MFALLVLFIVSGFSISFGIGLLIAVGIGLLFDLGNPITIFVVAVVGVMTLGAGLWGMVRYKRLKKILK